MILGNPELKVETKRVPVVTCHVLDTGFCMVPENHLVTSGRHMRVPVHAVAILLHHSAHGWFLFDTGYAPRLWRATAALPFRIYRWVTPFTAPEGLAVARQLNRFGLTCADISHIVLSHFHADHVAGLLDFPNVRLVAGREAWNAVRRLSSFRALAKGYISTLMPPDFEQRVCLIDTFTGPEVAPFGLTHDLFSDGSALLVRLPGHARGQLGLLVNSERGSIFFAADSYWMPTSLTRRELPHRITRFFGVDDWDAMVRTILNLADFALAHPEVRIVPTHCPEAFRRSMADLS